MKVIGQRETMPQGIGQRCTCHKGIADRQK